MLRVPQVAIETVSPDFHREPEVGALHFESDFLSVYQLTKKIGTLSIDFISSADSVRFPKFLVVVENSMSVPEID